MQTPITLHDVADDYVDTVTLVRWLVEDGVEVGQGQPILEVETAKTSVEVLAPASGVLRVDGEAGAEWDVSRPVGAILERSETAVRDSSPEFTASPRARRAARENDVDIAAVARGLGGADRRIREEDVLGFVERGGRRTGEASGEPDRDRRRAIAAHLTSQARTVPMVTLHADAAIGKAVATISGRWSLNDLLIAVVAQALRLHPTMNAYVDAEHDIVQRDDVHIGFAVDADAGLVVGVLADTARLSLGGIASGRQAVQRRVVDEGRPPERGQEATFTITNLGHLGIRYFNPILPARTGGILGVGQLHRQDDSSAILPLSLTFDHRLVDGAPAARFLKTVRQLIDDVDGWPDHWGS